MKKILRLVLLSLLFNWYSTIDLAATSNQIDVVKIENFIINPITANFIIKAIDTAEKNQAPCLIIQLDTPGGLLESTRDVVKKILNSDIPIITYVSPSGSHAASAGVFITYASHIAAMAPSTTIGSAHPIEIGLKSPFSKKEENTKQDDQDILTNKITNDLLAWIEGIARQRQRNVEWVKRAITESVSLTATEAVEQKIVNFLAKDINELLNKIDGKSVETISGPKTISIKGAFLNYVNLTERDKILNTIANPNISYILMLLGIIGLIFEFSTPGIGFSGIAGIICILLALYSFQILSVNYAGLALVAVAFILFVAEALTPGFGLLALGGIISFILGSLMLFKSSFPFLRVSLSIIIAAVITTAAITIFFVAKAIKIHRSKIKTGKEGLIGETAIALNDFDKKGKVFCHGEIWTAYNTRNDTIKKDQEVKIIKVDGLKLWVEKVEFEK